ncbi:hypothetical protein P167DRAFT_46070 [Morchella conica CCBAS932]|uniref:Uncharacterized protein n=1 Tax=Morchella conica CCBAS932 TaxID=1392247 RepID=A0A3N4KWB7_9PEZI|nr:hypothetical protein P167DRAFT_46070 [Morchella conica CCBAS932]
MCDPGSHTLSASASYLLSRHVDSMKVVVNIGGTYCAVVKRYSTADIDRYLLSCCSYITSRPNLNLNSSSRFPPPTTVTHPYHSTRSGIYTNVTLSHAMRGTSLSSKLFFFPQTKEDQREVILGCFVIPPFSIVVVWLLTASHQKATCLLS